MNMKGNHHQLIEVGDFCDNLETLEAAQRRMNNGDREGAMDEIRQLHDHILQSQEVKSVTHLLPTIEAIEGAAKQEALSRIRWEFKGGWGQLDAIQHQG